MADKWKGVGIVALCVICFFVGVIVNPVVHDLYDMATQDEEEEEYREWSMNERIKFIGYASENVTSSWEEGEPTFHPMSEGNYDMHYLVINNTGNRSFWLFLSLDSSLKHYGLAGIALPDGKWNHSESFGESSTFVGYVHNNSLARFGIILTLKYNTPYDVVVEDNSIEVEYTSIVQYYGFPPYAKVESIPIELPFKVRT